MYLSFYKLNKPPFQISTDPSFLWLGEKHKEALASLHYAIQDNKGFLLLTGEAGTGKTTLIHALLESLGLQVKYASISDPGLDILDFFRVIAFTYGFESIPESKGEFIITFSKFLHATYNSGQRVLLVIDEAQRLNQELLEEIRLLSNIEKKETKLLNIFFVGQPEFNHIILRPENWAIRQRIAVNYHIASLSEIETGKYIQHRLRVAGSAAPDIFEPDAVSEVFLFSSGYPRLINVICDRALISGYVENNKKIGAEIVRECAAELQIPLETGRHRTAVMPVARGHEEESQKMRENQLAPDKEIMNESAPSSSKTAPAATDALDSDQHPVAMSKPERDEKIIPMPSSGHGPVYGAMKRRLLLLSIIFLALMGAGYFMINPTGVSDFFVKNIAPTHPPPKPLEPEEVSARADTSSSSAPVGVNVQEKKSEAKSPLDGLSEAIAESPRPSIMPAPEDPAPPAVLTARVAPLPLTIMEASRPLDVNVGDAAPSQINQGETAPNPKAVIRFDMESSVIKPHGRQELDRLIAASATIPNAKIQVKGYTSNWGSEIYNKKLSEFRAEVVKKYMTEKGIKEENIETLGMGSQDPIASNDTLEGRIANRRVEVEIVRE